MLPSKYTAPILSSSRIIIDQFEQNNLLNPENPQMIWNNHFAIA